jgi:hypothetical protein
MYLDDFVLLPGTVVTVFAQQKHYSTLKATGKSYFSCSIRTRVELKA